MSHLVSATYYRLAPCKFVNFGDADFGILQAVPKDFNGFDVW